MFATGVEAGSEAITINRPNAKWMPLYYSIVRI